MNEPVATRRRGAVLEKAILEAAWTELSTNGYANFNMEAVVKRAGTSRPVVYRRWPNRLKLAMAAAIHQYNSNPVTVPDMGNVRDELCLLLRRYADRTPPKLMRLMFDMYNDMAAAGESFTQEGFRQYPLVPVIERGIARGEIDPKRVTRRISDLPLRLMLHDILSTVREISDEEIAEIIDEVFLPLVRPEPHRD